MSRRPARLRRLRPWRSRSSRRRPPVAVARSEALALAALPKPPADRRVRRPSRLVHPHRLHCASVPPVALRSEILNDGLRVATPSAPVAVQQHLTAPPRGVRVPCRMYHVQKADSIELAEL